MGKFVAGVLIVVGGFIVLPVVAVFCQTVLLRRVACPDCGGAGKGASTLVGYKKDWDGSSPYVMRDYPVYRRLKCARCGGSGTIRKSLSAKASGPTWSRPAMILQVVVFAVGLVILGSGAVLMARERQPETAQWTCPDGRIAPSPQACSGFGPN